MILDKLLYFLICMYIVVLPFSSTNLGRITIPSGDVILGLTIIVYIIKLLLSRDSRGRFICGIKDFFTNYLTIFMSALAVIMVISVSYAVEKKLALNESARFIVYIILFFMIKYENNTEEQGRGMIKSYLFTCLSLCLFGIYQYFTGFALGEKFKNYGYTKFKIAATMDNPNNLAAFLIIAIFPVIMLAIYEKRKGKKLFYIFLTLIMFLNLVLTGSRNAIVGIAVGIVILSILYSWKLVVLLGGMGALALFMPEIRNRAMAITNSTENQSRIYLWKIAEKMIKDHPLFGVGNGNYVSLYDKYTEIYPQYKFYGYHRWPSHNSYLKVESELGIIGGLSFICILISALVQVKKLINNTENKFYKFFYTGFLASMMTFYVMNLVDNLFFVPKTTSYFWILLAISQGIMFREKNKGRFSRYI